MVLVVAAPENVFLVPTIPSVTPVIVGLLQSMVPVEDVGPLAPTAVLAISWNAYHVQKGSPSSTPHVFLVLISVKPATMVSAVLVFRALLPILQDYVSPAAKSHAPLVPIISLLHASPATRAPPSMALPANSPSPATLTPPVPTVVKVWDMSWLDQIVCSAVTLVTVFNAIPLTQISVLSARMDITSTLPHFAHRVRITVCNASVLIFALPAR